jgi:hypothetical protein
LVAIKLYPPEPGSCIHNILPPKELAVGRVIYWSAVAFVNITLKSLTDPLVSTI